VKTLDTLDKTHLEYNSSIIFMNVWPFSSAKLQKIYNSFEEVDNFILRIAKFLANESPDYPSPRKNIQGRKNIVD